MFNPQKCCGGKCPCPCGASDLKCPNPELFPAECICDKDVPLDQRGLLVGLRTAKVIENTLLWEDCRDACAQDKTCYYWLYSVSNKQCELKEGKHPVGVKFYADKNYFWGHIPAHAQDNPHPQDVSWWEDWYNALNSSEKVVQYGYLSATPSKMTLSANEWQECEQSCSLNKPANCKWFVFDTIEKECNFYIMNGVFHHVDEISVDPERFITGPRLGNPAWTSDFSSTTRPQTTDRTGARFPPEF